SSITGKTGIHMEFPSVIIHGTEAREIIAHRLSSLLFAVGFILYCMISTCIIYNKGFFLQLKRLRVFLFSKYFLNPYIYYRATFYTTKKRFYVNCWGQIKISLQFITLFGFHSGGNFSLSAGG